MPSDSREHISIALRVLDSYVAYRAPDSADVEALRHVVSPPAEGLAPDDLARSVIEGELLKLKPQ